MTGISILKKLYLSDFENLLIVIIAIDLILQ